MKHLQYLRWNPLVPFRVFAINTNMACTRMYNDALINNVCSDFNNSVVFVYI
jgi:hypothetical protein